MLTCNVDLVNQCPMWLSFLCSFGKLQTMSQSCPCQSILSHPYAQNFDQIKLDVEKYRWDSRLVVAVLRPI